jgi:hypothetical protein
MPGPKDPASTGQTASGSDRFGATAVARTDHRRHVTIGPNLGRAVASMTVVIMAVVGLVSGVAAVCGRGGFMVVVAVGAAAHHLQHR